MTEQSDEERIAATLHDAVVRWEDHGGVLEQIMYRDVVQPLIERLRATEARVEHLKGLHLIDLDIIAEQAIKVAARDAAIAEAPHSADCAADPSWGITGAPCNCWKSAAPASVLREHDAATLEAAANELDRMYAGTDGTEAEKHWIGGVQSAARQVRARASAYRAGADQ